MNNLLIIFKSVVAFCIIVALLLYVGHEGICPQGSYVVEHYL